MDELAGGQPCKYLEWHETEDNEKSASNLVESNTGQMYEELMPSIRGEHVR
jgi:hypothetical protein